MVNLSNTVPPLIHKWSKAISLMNPKLMADFYCENAVLVGTYSKPYEIGKKQILKYLMKQKRYIYKKKISLEKT